MKDIKVGNIRLNSRDELSLKITVKNGDYTPVELQLLKNAEINGDILDISFTGLSKGDVFNTRKEKVSKLAYLMGLYCEKSGFSLDLEKKALYTRNKVESRSQLDDSQLDYEIELYKLGLQEF